MTVAWRPPPTRRFPVWPIRGQRDAPAPPGRGPDEVLVLENTYAQDLEVGPLIVGRPGFSLIGAGGTSQLGNGSNRTGQLVIQFTKRSGTQYTVAIVGGKFYTYDWGTDTFTEVLTASDFSGASITLSATARCYGVVFADNLVVSDGTNTPWAWDGTTNGGLTKLTNAPVFYGQPVVYYAKLFGIKNTARSTIVWSEEGVLNTGYEAGGYNNAWDLVQTATEGIEALAATDTALFVARQNSITAISGPVSTDFRTTGTREAVSDKFGTRAPATFRVIGGRVWFLDQFGALRVTSGGEPVEVGTGARQVLRDVPGANHAVTEILDQPETGHVVVRVASSAKSFPDVGLWLDRETGRYALRETGYESTRSGMVLDGTLIPTRVHIGGATAATVNGATDGYAYRHGRPDGTTWDDGLQAATAAIQHTVESGALGHDVRDDKLFLRADFSFRTPTALTGATLTFTTPIAESSPLSLATISAIGPQFGVAQFGVDVFGSGSGERKVTAQMRRRGRSCRVRLAHAAIGEQFQLSEFAVDAVPVSRRPGVR